MPKNKLVSPVLKWVGGKRQILPDIVELLPQQLNRQTYYEPFLGGGAVLFHLQPRNAIVNDFNSELVNLYIVIRDHLEELLENLRLHINEPEYFYHLRGLDRTAEFQNMNLVQKASRVVFLNKTCFNGLYRVNNSGEFNTPFGRYKNPNIVNEPTLRAVSRYLNNNNIQLLNGDYADAVANADHRSFVYFDPPYHPVSASSNFTGYIEGGWNEGEQIRLRELCDELTERNVKFLLSNSSTDFIRNQYANYDIKTVLASRSINSIGGKRGDVEEVLIRNYE
ncbi:DNA adenine methylase [Flavobacterium sp. PLA-1-15]|uniref:DNA adenine methylase n=1 Tax=Flavobacterium sp. PLA-1-15 TaxID=3380533 RepID=UPI003B7AC220